MRRHVGAIILLGGWLLMLRPPFERGPAGHLQPSEESADPPISEWWQESAYDTAAECERVRRQRQEHAFKDIERLAKTKDRDPMAAAWAASFGAARCVPAELVYPRKPK